jgi:aminotransferase
MKELSSIAHMESSPIRKMFEKAAKMDNVVNFSLGEPDFPTPKNIIDAAIRSLENADTHYTENAGMPILKRAVAKGLKEYDGIEYDPETEIAITASGMEGLYLTSLAVVCPGDEVILANPSYHNYKMQTLMRGATPVFVDVREENGFNFDINDLRAAVTDKTKAILLNSPTNPTGAVAPKELLEQIAELAIEKDLYIIFDEVYKKLLYDGKEFYNIARIPGMKERTIIIDSFSKTYAMTGWRVGYVAAPKFIAEKIPKIHEEILCCVPAFTQYACVEAIEHGDDAVRAMNREYERRRDVVYNGINRIEGLSCLKPGGAFYMFVNIRETGMTSEEFAMRLLEEARVAVSPGSAFGSAGEGFIRISYATSVENLVKGISRIERFMKGLKEEGRVA